MPKRSGWNRALPSRSATTRRSDPAVAGWRSWQHRRVGNRRQAHRHFRQFAERHAVGQCVERDLGDFSSVTLSPASSTRTTRRGTVRRGGNAVRYPPAGRLEPGGTALIDPYFQPQAGRVHQPQYALPATTVEPGSASRAITTPATGLRNCKLAVISRLPPVRPAAAPVPDGPLPDWPGRRPARCGRRWLRGAWRRWLPGSRSPGGADR